MTRPVSPISALIFSAFLLWHHVHCLLPPKLVTPSKEIRVKEGQTEVVLECELSIGDEPISYRWLKQMRLVTAELGHSYRAYRKVHLGFHTITPAHAGRYECEASNEAGVEAVSIDVVVESGGYSQKAETYEDYPDTENMLSELATSLNDVLAEGNCNCDVMFLLHASPDAPEETMKVQANFAYAISKNLISDAIRIAVMTYSDYVNPKMNFGVGTNKCALQEAFRDLSHEKWATRIDPVLREAFKRFKKSKKKCKVIVLPIFGSLGAEGAADILPSNLKKAGVKMFVLEVSNTPIPGVEKLASMRGDGKPYHFRVHMKRWPTIVTYMGYMSEELTGCQVKNKELPGICVNPGSNCTLSSQCEGIGHGCVQGVCQSLDCSARPDLPGCCKTEGDFWCGDVTYDCKSKDTLCDGKLQCMNGLDEDKCWKVAVPCQAGQYRCQTSVLCLPAHALCDGEPHCPGAEDEDPRFCWLFPCPSNRPFRCHDGKCISTESLCDGVFRDCAGGEDENLDYCSQKHVCPATRPFVCDYGVCMPDRVVCDGTYNCLDAMDEIVCASKTCPAERPFKCGDGKCIELERVCNGIVDACIDGTDERNCTSFVCPSSRSFKCMNGRCIDRWLECNRHDDCGDNSDELRCEHTSPLPTTTDTPPNTPPPTPACPDDQFYCTNGPCLSREEKICNGIKDCPGGEDEETEMCSQTPCPTSRSHRCPDGVCVLAILCDGNSDCPDGSDEDECYDNDYEYAEYDAYFSNYTTPSSKLPDTDDDATIIEHPDTDDQETVVEPTDPKKDSLPVVYAGGSVPTLNTLLICILLINSLFKWN